MIRLRPSGYGGLIRVRRIVTAIALWLVLMLVLSINAPAQPPAALYRHERTAILAALRQAGVYPGALLPIGLRHYAVESAIVDYAADQPVVTVKLKRF